MIAPHSTGSVVANSMLRVLQILRVVDSLQLTAKHSVATPVNWKHGEDVVVVPTLSDEQAKEKVSRCPFTRCRFGRLARLSDLCAVCKHM